ncbi:MAG: sodium:proton antiporter [Actinobacteria bacterium]|nr:sodium:proton antiporter [Actinomycetota bacterium]
MIGELCLLGGVLAPLAGSAVLAVPRRTAGWRCRTATGLAWLSTLLAFAAAVSVGLHGPFVVALDSRHGQLVLGLWANQLTVTLAVLVCAVGAVVQSFSLRYLQGDRTASRFFAAANVVVAAMAVVCTSATVTVLVGAWVIAGVAFVMLLGCRPDLPGVRATTRRSWWMFAAGDLALLAALLIMWVRAGNIDLASSGALQRASGHLGALTTVVALLVVVAALTRSAQGPLGRWLPGTVSAPTPASALLHAGVVNGGGILLVRLGVLTGGSMLAMIGVLVVGGITATVATALMTHKADVKGSLVFSTMSQMGFMVTECAVGAYLAAVVHLIGHALYKATLFFGSGSQVPRAGQAPTVPATAALPLVRATATVATTAATVGAMTAIPGMLAHRGATVLVIFAAATAASTSWSWSGRHPASTRWMVLWVTSLVGAGTLYGLVLDGLEGWISPSLAFAGSGILSPWWLAAMAAAGVAAAGLTRLPTARRRVIAILVNLGTPPVQLLSDREREAQRCPCAPAYTFELPALWEESAA